ncbi:MAG: hypothetical protein HOJ43_05820 [Betaproteobacteria bacterium]|nr:hypothetical protein [Betaproteobacteria bacterium]
MENGKPCWCATDFPNILSGGLGDGCLCSDCISHAINLETMESDERLQ